MANLQSFRQLLLKKTDDESLRTLIKFSSDSILVDQVIESLEKMAVNRNRGSHANAAIRDFGTEIDPELEPAMIREALGHHASRYKAALKQDNQSAANKHAENFFKILDMVHKAEPHSHGKLQADMVDIKPWERTHPSRSETFADRIARDPEYAKENPVTRGKKLPHHFVNDTVGFSFKPKGNDWSFLQNDPHESYKNDTLKTGHQGAYPMEHTKINGKYIPIEDVEDLHDANMSHPFDKHPIMEHYGESVKKRSPERDSQYIAQRNAYMDSPNVEKHLEHYENLHNEGKLETRGSSVGEPVHGDLSRFVKPGDKSTPVQQVEDKKTIIKKPSVDEKPAARTEEPSFDEAISKLSPKTQKYF
jgi:hypothetical protein